MKPSPLQIEHYFVTDLHFAVNAGFDAKRKVELIDDQFVVDSFLLQDEKAPEKWQVTLRIKHLPTATTNAPYSIALDVVGYFAVASNFPKDKVERLVKTNGSSMLYSIAREIARTVTSMSPHLGLMLPSVSFYESLPQVLPQPQSEPAQISDAIKP